MLGKLKNTTKRIFSTAIANGMINRDPCLGVNFPPGVKSEEKRSYNSEQYKIVLDYSRAHDFGLGVFIILSTGFRCGELMGIIPKKDIGPDYIMMQRTVTSRGVPSLKEGGKTKCATRKIPLYKEGIFYQHLNRLGILNKPDLLFQATKRKNGLLSPSDWSRQFYKRFTDDLAIDHPNVPILTPHELRHTFGTMLYKKGVPLDAIQIIMGHSNMDVTKQIYIHDDFEDLKNRYIPIDLGA